MSFLNIFHDAVQETAPVAFRRMKWKRTVRTSSAWEEQEGTGGPNTTSERTIAGQEEHPEPTLISEQVRRSVGIRGPNPVRNEVFNKRLKTGKRN